MAMTAHPAALTRRSSYHERIVRRMPGDGGASGYKRVLANRNATNYGSVGTDRAASFQQCLLVQVMPDDLRPGIRIVGQDARRPKKHVVLNDHPCVNRDAVLHLHIGTDHHIPGHVAVLAEDAPFSDLPTCLHVAEMPDLRSLADLARLIDIGRFVFEIKSMAIRTCLPRYSSAQHTDAHPRRLQPPAHSGSGARDRSTAAHLQFRNRGPQVFPRTHADADPQSLR